MRENSFTLEDYLQQFESMKKMGGIKNMLAMLPGIGGKLKMLEDGIDESKIERTKAIIYSMTAKERNNPDIINGSRRKRIGVHPNDNTATVWLHTEDLVEIIQTHGTELEWAEL